MKKLIIPIGTLVKFTKDFHINRKYIAKRNDFGIIVYHHGLSIKVMTNSVVKTIYLPHQYDLLETFPDKKIILDYLQQEV